MILQFLRKKKNMKRIVWGLAILIIPAFVLWGAGSASRNRKNGPNYAGKIFNKKISFDKYINIYNVTRGSLIDRLGANAPIELIDQLTWNRILLLEATERENIVVKDGELLETITSLPIFQREGAFDKKLYQSMLQNNAKAFEERLRDDIRISKLQEALTSDIQIEDKEARDAYIDKFKKILATYISIPFSDFEKDITYEDNSLVTFYEQNKEKFRKPEEVNVRYLEILLSSENAEELVYKVLDEVVDKKSLNEPAKTFSLEIKETGFFNMQQEIPDIGWSYEFSQQSFKLKPGQAYSVPIKTDKAIYLIQLKEKKPSSIPDFEEVKESVIESYTKINSISIAKAKAEEIYSKGLLFEEMANELGKETKQTELITQDSYIPTLGPGKEFVEACLLLKENEVARPVQMQESWVIARLDRYEDIDETKFNEEKETFKAGLLARKKQSYFDSWFQAFRKESNFVSYTSELE